MSHSALWMPDGNLCQQEDPLQFVFKLPLSQRPESAISGGFFVPETHIRIPCRVRSAGASSRLLA